MKGLMFRFNEERKADESRRAKEEMIINKELNTAKDLLKKYRENIEAMDKVVKEMKTTKAAMLSNEQEKVDKLSIRVEQYLQQIEALKEENVALRKELKKNENALNEGFNENKMLSEKYNTLKSHLQKVLDGM